MEDPSKMSQLVRLWVLKIILFQAHLISISGALGGERNHGMKKLKSSAYHAQAQVEFLRSNGGFVSDKVKVTQLFPSDHLSPLGIFAEEPITTGEKLLIVPPHAVLSSRTKSDYWCANTRLIMQEYRKGEASFFFPYVEDLVDGRHPRQLPSAWSDSSIDLFQLVIGDEMPPDDLDGVSFYEDCDGSGDEWEEHVYHAMLQRSTDDKMIPVLDLLNHRNGNWTNVNTLTNPNENDDEDIILVATRDIHPGEQLYLTYTLCKGYEHLHYTYSTPRMVREMGFIEDYPQRWLFNANPDLLMEIDEPHPGEYAINWMKGVARGSGPNLAQMNALRAQWRRVQDIQDRVEEGLAKLDSIHEHWLISKYYASLRIALMAALRQETAVTGYGGREDTKPTYLLAGNCFMGGAINGTYDAALFGTDDVCRERPELNIMDASGIRLVNAEKLDDYVYHFRTPSLLIDSDHPVHEQPGDVEGALESACMSADRYDTFKAKQDPFLDYDEKFCDETYGLDDVIEIYELEETYSSSFHEKIDVYTDEARDDTCLVLDDVLFSCSSFRPHVHEMLVHYPARYLENVRRVAVIGGRGLLTLHEILKYPELELAVVLEHDQTVARVTSTLFDTEGGLDHDKVEWWFGDPAESLASLLETYHRSFDLVVLDLPIGLVYTSKDDAKDLDIWDAAVLLLNPTGVVVGTEDFSRLPSGPKYYVKLEQHDIPHLCSQRLFLGSHSVDFVSQPLHEHPVDTLFLKPPKTPEDRFQFWFDYERKSEDGSVYTSSRLEQGEIAEPDSLHHSSSGVLMAIEVEGAALSTESPSTIRKSVRKALDETGLSETTSTSMVSYQDENETYSMHVFLEQGYVLLRVVPSSNYIAFDLFLWKDFEKQNEAKARLVEAVGGKSGRRVSSFRMVIGPLNTVSDYPTFPTPMDKTPTSIEPQKMRILSSLSDKVIVEATSLIQDKDKVVVVLCIGMCHSINLLQDSDPRAAYVPLIGCPFSIASNETSPGDDLPSTMLKCEVDTLRRLEKLVEESGRITGIIMTPEVPIQMAQILHRILSFKVARLQLLGEQYTVVAAGIDRSTRLWQRNFLDRFRTEFEIFDPAHVAEVLLRDEGDDAMYLSVFSSGVTQFYPKLMEMLERIREKSGLVGELEQARNGLMNYVADFVPSSEFSSGEYSVGSEANVWREPKAVGLQTIIQAVLEEKPPVSALEFYRSFRTFRRDLVLGGSTRSELKFSYENLERGGCHLSALWAGGSAVVVWGGGLHITVNLFTYSQRKELHTAFERLVWGEFPRFAAIRMDEQPRGIGNVLFSTAKGNLV